RNINTVINLLICLYMCSSRIALIKTGVEKNLIPKKCNFVKMTGPVSNYFIKYRPQEFVLSHQVIKGVYNKGYIISILQISGWNIHGQQTLNRLTVGYLSILQN